MVRFLFLFTLFIILALLFFNRGRLWILFRCCQDSLWNFLRVFCRVRELMPFWLCFILDIIIFVWSCSSLRFNSILNTFISDNFILGFESDNSLSLILTFHLTMITQGIFRIFNGFFLWFHFFDWSVAALTVTLNFYIVFFNIFYLLLYFFRTCEIRLGAVFRLFSAYLLRIAGAAWILNWLGSFFVELCAHIITVKLLRYIFLNFGVKWLIWVRAWAATLVLNLRL